MDPNYLIVMAVLNNCIADERKTEPAHRIPEPDFAPFNLSYLQDFSNECEQEKNASTKFGENVSSALPA
jgi:hypothetical protein